MIPSDLLLAAYASGWFPMADEAGIISWYSPDPRGVLPLDTFHVPSRLQRTVRRSPLQVHVDTAFPEVMRACAEAERDSEDGGTWISDEIIASYTTLHSLGYAHSVAGIMCLKAWETGRRQKYDPARMEIVPG